MQELFVSLDQQESDKMSKTYEIKCAECGTLFIANRHCAKYCGPECRGKAEARWRTASAQRCKERAKAEKNVVKKPSAAEIDAAASEVGMSYGHYVALHNL